MDYILSTNKLTKKYRRFTALDELDMHIPGGSIYGFVGKNGAGKTTLMRIICGLQEPTSGSYTLYGKENRSSGIAKARARMGAVVETPSIYLDMTAEENLKQQFQILGLPSYDEIPHLLNLVGLEAAALGKKKAKNFSLGMRQRLGIAIAHAGHPDFLALDEPINGLDPEGIVEMRELILKLNREHAITVLISSHILDELSKLATHFGFIGHGQIVKEISAADLEQQCRKCISVVVSNTEKLSQALEKNHISYEITGSGQADLFTDISLTSLVSELNQTGCELISASNKDESLESYYIELLGGGQK